MPEGPTHHTDRFDEAGTRIAAVLRAEADALLREAREEADALRAQAQLDAEEARAELQAERDEAKRLLVRARQRADALLTEADQRAAARVNEAEGQAQVRIDAVLTVARARVDRLASEEQRARDRLLAAHGELARVVDRLADPATLIDLTEPVPTVRSSADHPARVPAGGPATVPVTTGDASTLEQADPLAAMVRGAVDRAVAHSRREEGQTRRS